MKTMLDKRLELHNKLVEILGSNHVYFQPPESITMTYPCIVYERHDINNIHADDDAYLQPLQYKITVIDRDPDSTIVEKVSKLKKTRFINHFVSSNLNHDIFEIYY